MTTTNQSDPFQILGVPADAGEAEIRARYLELVKKFPPEREPEKFREVHAAYEAARDPLLIARRLLEPPAEEPPQWSQAIEEQRQIRPPLTPAFLLSLGNRAPEHRASVDASG
ncbi:MAG: J domain-containing protein [Planctomycetota bacterium]|nr:MAG: J domain-containing protein [Planctomycetota bacterium]REK31353.1 MAG: J domain-containing protein [Planctomycetota bacterium]REK39078.1 MAG: J domain-containing protein [Planctomycetota bacterium]